MLDVISLACHSTKCLKIAHPFVGILHCDGVSSFASAFFGFISYEALAYSHSLRTRLRFEAHLAPGSNRATFPPFLPAAVGWQPSQQPTCVSRENRVGSRCLRLLLEKCFLLGLFIFKVRLIWQPHRYWCAFCCIFVRMSKLSGPSLESAGKPAGDSICSDRCHRRFELVAKKATSGRLPASTDSSRSRFCSLAGSQM